MRMFEIAPGENEEFDIRDGEFDKYIRMIQRDCSDAITAMQKFGNFLYRGMNGDVAKAFLSRPDDHRKSQNHNTENNDKFDAIAAAAGYTALRHNSIFVNTDVSATLLYGKPYLVFPKNGFTVTWSPKVFVFKDDINPSDLDKPGFLEKYEYQNGNLADAMESANEILIHGEYYSFIAVDYEEQLRSALF